MLDIKVIIIIALLILSYYQYAAPDSSQAKLAPYWGKVHDFVTSKNPFASKAEPKDNGCPDTDNPVCGSDGVTYKNICYAAVKDILQVTPGACT